MARNKSYSSGNKYGRRKWKRVVTEYPETFLPEQEAEADFLSSLILILIIVVLAGLAWFISGPKSNLGWVSKDVSAISRK